MLDGNNKILFIRILLLAFFARKNKLISRKKINFIYTSRIFHRWMDEWRDGRSFAITKSSGIAIAPPFVTRRIISRMDFRDQHEEKAPPIFFLSPEERVTYFREAWIIGARGLPEDAETGNRNRHEKVSQVAPGKIDDQFVLMRVANVGGPLRVR